MELKYWAATDVGRKRAHNEDNYLIDKDLRLFVVADGMGGHASGEVASAMAVHGIRDVIAGEHDLLEQTRDEDPSWHVELCTLLDYAIHVACEDIHRKAQQEPEKRGMGTTVVALLLVGERGYIGYVGDSRLYLLRGGVVYQLTEDHSLMNELVRKGKVRADEFEESQYAQFKNAMTRAVGPTETVEVDTLDFDVIPGDAFLLCTDGLYEYLDDDDISRALTLPEIEDIPGYLVDLANTRGGKDNITSLVVKTPGSVTTTDRAQELNLSLDTLRRVPLFKQLSYQQLLRVLNATRMIPITEGQRIFKDADEGDELFVVISGVVELTKSNTVISTLGPGDHFGEMGLIDGAPRSADAIARDNGRLLTINRREFYEILRKDAPLAVQLLWSFLRILSDRLRETTEALGDARDAAIEEVSADLLEEE